MRVAIYARYSTDRQRDASIEDQVRLCKERLERDGHCLIQTYVDRATSGASMLRPGLQALIEDAMAARFDMIVTEALDRLSRDQADIAALYKRFRFAGVGILTLAEGDINELHIGLKGTMNQLFLKDLADKTRRGLRGRVEAGKSGGGNSYGYTVARTLDSHGELQRGNRIIDEAEAATVRRIFRDYAAGASPRGIAAALNAEHVPGPSGVTWGASTIQGNPKRGSGILNNELYIGRLIWNRLRYIKDPATGKRVSRPNPPDEWVTTDVPDLRIINGSLWERVKQRQATSAYSVTGNDTEARTLNRSHRPRYLFSGLLRCGSCGGSFTVLSARHVGCANARNKGTCESRRVVRRQEIEERILSALSTRLMDETLFAHFCDAYVAETNHVRAQAEIERHNLESTLVRIKRDLARLVDAILSGAPTATVNERIAVLEVQRFEAENALAQSNLPAPAIHPAMAIVYRKKVVDLAKEINRTDTRLEATEILRGLVERIVVVDDGRDLALELHGDLAGILSLASESKQPSRLTARGLQVSLVAGAGFEPAAFRL